MNELKKLQQVNPVVLTAAERFDLCQLMLGMEVKGEKTRRIWNRAFSAFGLEVIADDIEAARESLKTSESVESMITDESADYLHEAIDSAALTGRGALLFAKILTKVDARKD